MEWNMYFPNLGHNLCDGHAGHMKRYEFDIASFHVFYPTLILSQVKQAEADFTHMYNISNVVDCMVNLKNSTQVTLTYDEINACDDAQAVSAVGEGFIKRYHHFQYVRSGVVKCKVKKCDPTYTTHMMLKAAGEFC